MTRLALILPLLMIATPALAQEKLIVADCGDGGCRCALSALTMEEAGVVIGASAPEGSAALVRHGGDYIWSPLSPSEIDLVAGGDGECPLELFEAMTPEDGSWVGSVVDRKISQCPAGLDAALAPVTEALVFPRDIAWGGSFHPDRIRMQGAARAIDWTRVDERRFTGEGPSASQRGGSSVEIGVSYDARLIDPRLVRILVRLKIRTRGPSQAVLDAVGMGRCDVTVTVDLAKTGG